MTIAEKLILIAENTPKVYEVGKSEGIEQGYEQGHSEGLAEGYNNGYPDGKADGYAEGYEKGKAEGGDTTAAYEQGVVDGKQAEYDAFWDAYQVNGNRVNYQYAFSNSSWKDEIFKPKYDLVLGPGYSGTYMFYSCAVTDLTAALERQGVVLDTSQNGYFMAMFQTSKCKRIPPINLSRSHEYGNSLLNFFLNSTVETIDKLIVTENTIFANNSFQGCADLINVTFEGVIGKNGLNLQWSTKLTHESLVSIIDCLQDKSTDTSGTVWKVTVGSTNYAKLTENDIANITAKGWIFE